MTITRQQSIIHLGLLLTLPLLFISEVQVIKVQAKELESTAKTCIEEGSSTYDPGHISLSVPTESTAEDPSASSRVWKWQLDADHRCNIPRVSHSELHATYPGGLPPLYHEPLIIYDETQQRQNLEKQETPTTRHNAKFAEMTSQSQIINSLPKNFNVTLSSSNSFSSHRRTIPLAQYIEDTTTHETYPHDLSNETWYLFGETYTQDWKTLLESFTLPPCQTCTSDLSALAFGIGGRGSGVQWHLHGPGFSESIHGRKHWILYPPERRPNYDPDYTSRHWMEVDYMNLMSLLEKDGNSKNEDLLPWECTLFPGDMVYFPDKWHHATINLDRYTVFVSTFTTEHGF